MSNLNRKPLTLNDIRVAVDRIKKRYPDGKMLKEFRVQDHNVIKQIIPDPPKEDLPFLWSILVVVDPDMDPHKIKFVYRDGHEETYDV